MQRVVNFSGGVCSYLAAKRVVEKFGPAGVTLLFANTKMEDEDLYRFNDAVIARLGVEFVELTDGRTPWDVFFDKRFLGNSRVDPCSLHLKRNLLDQWHRMYCEVDNTTIYVGLNWDEVHRFDRFQNRMQPWVVDAPMMWKPWLNKREMIEETQADGIEPPRLYAMGFAHNNCGGFCIKAGQASFRLLLEKMPERYAYHEQKEQEFRETLGQDVAILRDRQGGESRPLTLKELRERAEFDPHDIGGCGCAID